MHHHDQLERRPLRIALVALAFVAVSCEDTTAPEVDVVLSEPSVSFRAIRGNATPLTQTITISNGGSGRLGPVSCPANPATWLTCSVSAGNSVTLTANPAGLAASPAPVSVPITARGAPNRPQTVLVTLVIDQPVLTVSSNALSFAALEGVPGTTPTSATVTLTNTGAGGLANLGAITCAPSPANSRVTCAVNQSNGLLTLNIDPAGLAPGLYTFPVVVSAANNSVSQTVTLTLFVGARPQLSLSQQALVFQAIRGTSGVLTQTVTVSNAGGGSLGIISCPSNPVSWLSCTVSGNTLIFTANPAGLTASPAAVSVPITATGAANSPQSVTVNLTIQQPVLSLSENAIAFTARQGQTVSTPTLDTVLVTNTGAGTLANLGTITCAPTSTTAPVTCVVNQTTGELVLSVNPTGVTLGTHVYPVVVNAANSTVTRTLAVTLSVTGPAKIALSPKTLNFSAIRGSTTLLPDTVFISNAGTDSLGTISCPPNPAPWLTCVVVDTTRIAITANPSGLTTSPGTVLVPISAAFATNSPQTVTVKLIIEQPILSLSTSTANFTYSIGTATLTPASVVVTATNSGAGTLANLGTISCAPSDARVSCVVNQSTGALTISADAVGLAAGTYVYSVTVSSPNQGNGPQTVTVVLTVNP